MTDTRTESPRPRGGDDPSSSDGWWLGRLFASLLRFGREIVAELRKVIWPSRQELVTYTLVVLVFVVILVALVAGLDLGFARLVLWIFG